MSVEIVRTGSSLPRIVQAHALDGRKVKITWASGETKTIDLMPALASRRRYIPLRKDDALFQRLRVSDYGDAIEWNDDLDFSAIWIERLASADFGNAEFRDAMDRLELSLDGMAAALEISRRQIADFRKNKPIPRHIALATRYLLDREGKKHRAG